MDQQQHAASLETLKDIRSIMDRSSRFISLSGWSGVWAGCVALVAAFVAARRLDGFYVPYSGTLARPDDVLNEVYRHLIVLAVATFAIAFVGAFYFTARKAKRYGQTLWSATSKKLFLSVLIPIIAGGVFCLNFIYQGDANYVAPACLAFYGLALVNGGKYTLGEIRYLGYCELALGCLNLFFWEYSLYFWAVGFGVLHIIYGIIMWNRYDKKEQEA